MYAYKTTSDRDTLYLYQAMRPKEWRQFRIVMQTEIDDRMEGQNFSIIHKSKSPQTATVLPVFW